MEREFLYINGVKVVLEPRFKVEIDYCYCDRLDQFEDYQDDNTHEREVVMRRDSQDFSTRDYNYLVSLGLEMTTEWGATSYTECDEYAIQDIIKSMEGDSQ